MSDIARWFCLLTLAVWGLTSVMLLQRGDVKREDAYAGLLIVVALVVLVLALVAVLREWSKEDERGNWRR